jgi:phosphoribosylformylglycinamidine synthase
VHGIGHYGNCIGIPNIGGECEFDRSYDFNNLVNAMAIGHVKNDSIFYSKPKTIGGLIVYIGSKTGKDGIHGASMASDVFSEDDEDDKRPSVQVGDPFMEKLLMEGCLELMSSGLIESMQDMGAAGITSSSVEMASKGEVGVLINLDKIPLREPLSPYEILLSESQERMLAVIEPENNVKVKNILKKWQIDYEVIGEITDTQRVVFSSNNKNVVDLPVDIIVDDAPEYDREFYLPKKRAFNDFNLLNLDIENMIDNLFENLNYLDKSWVYNQYDSTVMGDTIKEPGQSSGIVKLHDSDKVIGATTDCNPLYLRINPEKGMEYTVLESFRNLVCSNLKPLAITNNLNFASPLDPNIMGEIVLSINGLKKSASKLDTPIVSGNVSLYNQTNDRPIKPTPVIGMVGSNRNYKNINSNKFQNENDLIFLIGNSMKKNNSPYFLQDQHIIQKENQFNDLVEIDYNLEKDNSEMLFNLFNQNLITSCNDISRGGIFLSLIKMLQKNYGFRINVKDKFDMFCEYQAGYIFTIREINYPMLKNAFEEKKLNYQNLGKVTTESIEINSKKFDYFDIINKYLNNFEKTIN